MILLTSELNNMLLLNGGEKKKAMFILPWKSHVEVKSDTITELTMFKKYPFIHLFSWI